MSDVTLLGVIAVDEDGNEFILDVSLDFEELKEKLAKLGYEIKKTRKKTT